MHRRTPLALIAPFLMTVQDIAPKPGPEPANREVLAQPTTADVASLSLDEVIKRLPPAGCEWTWDRTTNAGTENPASEEMARRLTAGTKLSDAQWRAALLTTGAMRFRAKWPSGEDYCVSMTVPRWLGLSQIRIAPRVAGMRAASVGELHSSMSGTFTGMDARDARAGRRLGRVPAGTTEIVFDAEIERGEAVILPWDDVPEPPPPGMIWRGTIAVPIRLVDTFEQVADAADTKELREAVRDAVGAGVRAWGEDLRRVPFVVIDPDCATYPALEETGLDLKVELLEDDTPVAEVWLVAMDLDELALTNSMSKGGRRFYGSANLHVAVDNPDPSCWVLRLTGKSEHIRFLWHAKRWWSGTMTIPWSEAIAREAERVGPLGRGPEVSTPHWR